MLATKSSGEQKKAFTVRRTAAFSDAYREAIEAQLLDKAATCSVKIFPTFVDAAASVSGIVPSTEGGEGHGPRREFFECVGQEMGATASSNAV